MGRCQKYALVSCLWFCELRSINMPRSCCWWYLDFSSCVLLLLLLLLPGVRYQLKTQF